MGEKGDGFIGTIIKNTWTISRGIGNRGGRWGGLGWCGGVRGKVRKLYLNNNKNVKKIKINKKNKFLPLSKSQIQFSMSNFAFKTLSSLCF